MKKFIFGLLLFSIAGAMASQAAPEKIDIDQLIEQLQKTSEDDPAFAGLMKQRERAFQQMSDNTKARIHLIQLQQRLIELSQEIDNLEKEKIKKFMAGDFDQFKEIQKRIATLKKQYKQDSRDLELVTRRYLGKPITRPTTAAYDPSTLEDIEEED